MPVVSTVTTANKPSATTDPLPVVTVRMASCGALPGSTGSVLLPKKNMSSSLTKSTAVIAGPITVPPTAGPPSAT